MKRSAIMATAVAVASTLGGGVSVAQQGDSRDLLVRATVGEVCSLITPSGDWLMNFGTYDIVEANPLDAEYSFQVQCVQGVDYYITIDEGQDFQAGAQNTRRMNVGAGGTATTRLPYRLYSDSGRTVEWTTDQYPAPQASDGNADTYTIYGRVPGGRTNQETGIYTDVVSLAVFLDS